MADPSLLRFRTVVEGALGELEARRQEVNDLNVFPVADGDTGDNMTLTLRAVLDELDRLSEHEGPLDEIGRDEIVDSVARAALLGARGAASRPHEDPDPALRVARRILQRLDGMGKWGGYHTDFAHLARGFAGNDRQLASDVGEALLDAGLLAEKPSVGQRHVFLNPRRARDIRAFIETGEAPVGLRLPQR